MLHGLRSLALVLGSLAWPSLADRSSKEALGIQVAQKLDGMQNSVEALQEKQNRVISKLEAEAHVAKLSSSLGHRNADVEAARSAVAAELERHLQALMAELQFMKSQDFPYANFRQVGKFVEERSKKIGEAIDRMAPILPNMQQKSEDYKHNNFLLQQGVKQLEGTVLPDFFDKVTKEKKQEVHDMQWMDMNEAYTARDRKVLAEATQDDWDLIKHGQFKRTPDANFGQNPYGSMSNEHWESHASEWPVGFGSMVDEAHQVNGSPLATSLPLSGSPLDASDSTPSGNFSQSATPPDMSFVEVHPHALKLFKNSVQASKYSSRALSHKVGVY